jgi:nucleoside 2-deoxyribosyltransferase
MKIYLAARYSQKEEMKLVAKQLRCHGHIITSTWLEETEPPDVTLDQLTEHFLAYQAEVDLNDIKRADIFVLFSIDPLIPTVRGGRHVETGVALALGKPIYVVGPKENIFHYLPGVKIFSCVSELIYGIKEVEV